MSLGELGAASRLGRRALTSIADLGPRWHGLSQRRRRRVLLLYGLTCAAVGIALLATSTLRAHVYMQNEHVVGLYDEFDAMKRGVWPITELNPTDHLYYVAGAADDQGSPLLVPSIGWLVGSSDPVLLFKWFYFVALGAVLLSYPLVFGELLGSALAAMIAPIAAFALFVPLGVHDTYTFLWLTAAVCLPPVMLVSQRWRRPNIMILGAVMVVAGAGSLMRAYSGLPVLLAALIVLLWKERRWGRRGAIAVALVLAYATVPYGLLGLAKAYRQLEYGNRIVNQHLASSSFWHNAYIGLGFQPNRYGIFYNDNSGDYYAQSVDPHVGYLTVRYENILRHRVLTLARNDPGFVVKTEGRKALFSLDTGLARYPELLLLVPAILFLGPRRRLMRRAGVLLVPALLVAIATPIVAIPSSDYAIGWLGTLALVLVLCLTWLAASVTESVEALRSDPVPSSSGPALAVRKLWRSNGVVLTALVSVAAVLGFAGVHEASKSRGRVMFYSSAQPSLPPGAVAGRTLHEWTFGRGVPSAWTSKSGTQVQQVRGGSSVVTAPLNADQLVSPPITLPAGYYVGFVRGAVESNGMAVTLLDARTDTVLGNGFFEAGRQPARDQAFGSGFALYQRSRVQLIVANWSPIAESSRWFIHSAVLMTAPWRYNSVIPPLNPTSTHS